MDQQSRKTKQYQEAGQRGRRPNPDGTTGAKDRTDGRRGTSTARRDDRPGDVKGTGEPQAHGTKKRKRKETANSRAGKPRKDDRCHDDSTRAYIVANTEATGSRGEE